MVSGFKKYPLVLAFFAGVLLSQTVWSFTSQLLTSIYAHGGDINLIHGCVNKKGVLSIIGANEKCDNNETAMDWVKQTSTTELPFFCTGCDFTATGTGTNVLLASGDYSGTIFSTSNFGGNNLSGKNFSHSKMVAAVFQYCKLVGTNFTGADLRQATIGSCDATGANFTDANLEGATDLGDATILTNAIWDHTICPDGTNSDSHGNTCEGHLTP